MPLKSMRFRRFALSCLAFANHGISSLFHANASEAKPCRSESLRCTTFPSQITSALFSAIPLLCYSKLILAFPSLCLSVLLSAAALPRPASPCHCCSLLFIAVPSLCHAVRCHCTASSCSDLPLLRCSTQCLCQSLPLAARLSLCGAVPCEPCHFSADHGCQCHALALRLSPHRRCR